MPKRLNKAEKNPVPLLFNDDDSEVVVDHADLEKELLELLGDSNADDSLSETVDVNDPKLLAELEAFVSKENSDQATAENLDQSNIDAHRVTPTDVDGLVAAYYDAIESLNAKDPVDTSQVKRYERVLEELECIASRISEGQVVRPDELPLPPSAVIVPKTVEPTVSVRSDSAGASSNVPLQSPTKVAAPTTLMQLKKRSDEYKLAAVEARDAGQLTRARELLLASKFITDMIPKVASGEEPFDPETDMPPPPDEYSPASEALAPTQPPAAPASSSLSTDVLSPVVTEENLKLRMAYFKSALESAASDASKARRLKRVLEQYSNAMAAFTHQVLSFNYAELPPPPGCPPLSRPVYNMSQPISDQRQVLSQLKTTPVKNQKMINLLQTRQVELKAAALKAKESGDINLAKTHLRAALSMNTMIDSAKAGLPVDLSKVPRAPSSHPSHGQHSTLPTTFQGPIMTGSPCDIPATLHLELEACESETGKRQILLNVLIAQTKEANELADRLYKAGMSDIARKLVDLAKLSESSATFLTGAIKQKRPVTFTFELANLPQLNFNHDLGDGVLEVCVVRGISYPLPSDISNPDKLDTQVELLLPYPTSDNPQKHYTDWVKHTCDPNYDSTTRFQVDTKSRSFQFLVKSNRGIKATVYYSRGFLRSARVLGTANFQLGELARSVTFTLLGDLMEGRKAVGGRLELRLRQRSVGSGAQIMSCQKPWLILSLPKPSKISPPGSTNDRLVEVRRDRTEAPLTIVEHANNPPSTHTSSTGHPPQSNDSFHTRKTRSSSGCIYSLDLLCEDKHYFEQRLADPGLPPEKQEIYRSKLTNTDRLIQILQTRLQNKNAPEEIANYVNDLRILIKEARQQYDKYKSEDNEQFAAHYQHRVQVISKELDRYTKVPQNKH